MALRPSSLIGFAAAVALAAGAAFAGDEPLYPSGPPNGVAYLRFANLTPQAITVTSASAKITLPANGEERVRRYDPVNPGSELTGTVQLGDHTAPIKVTLTQNEFVTIAVTQGNDGNLMATPLRETPSDFNAAKSSLALYNLDPGCSEARLFAGDAKTVVISGIGPEKVGRRAVNPVDVALSAACADNDAVSAKLGALAAGERYSVFVFAEGGQARQVLALHDETAPFRR
jgi:hypothetical protein